MCVCNATYCDTVEADVPLAKGTVAQYLTTRDGDERLYKTLHKFDNLNKTGTYQSFCFVHDCLKNSLGEKLRNTKYFTP